MVAPLPACSCHCCWLLLCCTLTPILRLQASIEHYLPQLCPARRPGVRTLDPPARAFFRSCAPLSAGTMAMDTTISQVITINTITNSNRFKVGLTTMIGIQGRLVVIDDKNKKKLMNNLQCFAKIQCFKTKQTVLTNYQFYYQVLELRLSI